MAVTDYNTYLLNISPLEPIFISSKKYHMNNIVDKIPYYFQEPMNGGLGDWSAFITKGPPKHSLILSSNYMIVECYMETFCAVACCLFIHGTYNLIVSTFHLCHYPNLMFG
jgi:hypothetical protein